MLHTEGAAGTHGRAGHPGASPIRTGGTTTDTAAPDAKALPRRPPGAQSLQHGRDGALSPWLKERKAQDLGGGHPSPQALHELLAITRSAALREPDFASQCALVYPVIEGIDEVPHDLRGEAHLVRLLQAVLQFDEASPQPAILFAAWLRFTASHLSDDGLVPFVLQALDEHPPRSADALANVIGHLALHALRGIHERPDLVFTHTGRLLSWLLAQDPPRRAEGLAALGDGLGSSRHLTPRHLCEVLQAVAAARDRIGECNAAAGIRVMLDRIAGPAGWRGIHAQSILQSLASRSASTTDPLPRDEALATVRGLIDATLHPGIAPQELGERLPPWQDLQGLAALSAEDLAATGRAFVAALGGDAITPAVLHALVAQLAAQPAERAGDTARAGALLRGVVQAAGGKDIDDAPLAQIASALAQAPGGAGPALTLALASALDTLGAQRALALPALGQRLERLLPLPLPAALRTGLALAGDPLGASLHAGPLDERLAGIDAAYALPGFLDEAMVARQLWGCALTAATDPPLAVGVALRLLRQAGGRVTPAAFRELRAALLPQATMHLGALSDLYACFAQHGRFDEPAPTAVARKQASKAGSKVGGQARSAGSARRADAAVKFLREEAQMLARSLARVRLEPLARALEALASELASGKDHKR